MLAGIKKAALKRAALAATETREAGCCVSLKMRNSTLIYKSFFIFFDKGTTRIWHGM
jgi:hypothetical protein